MMASQPALTSPDGSSNGKPPERCPRPLYSHRDPTQEGHAIPHHHRTGSLRDVRVDVKEEIKDEDEEYGVMNNLSEGHKEFYKDIKMEPPCNSHQNPTQSGNLGFKTVVKEEFKEEDEEYGVMTELPEGHNDHYEDIKMEPPNNRNPPERCPHPLYAPRDLTQEGLGYGRHDLGEDVMDIKVEGEVEETYVRDDQQYTEEEEAGMTRTFIEEDTPTQISTGCKVEDEDITPYSPGEDPPTQHVHPPPHSVDGSSYPEQPQTVRDGADLQKRHSCTECGKCYIRKSTLVVHQRTHTGEKPYSCPECGKCYPRKWELVTHQRTHTGEKPYSCPECGKCYPRKSELVTHQRTHTGQKPYSCPECGKCFSQKSYLSKHQLSHTVEKPFSCSECGKCFARKYGLVTHQTCHTGEKPYSCPECGQCYSQKSTLIRHQRSHTGENPYSCTECGKCYPRKSELVRHQRSHTGERPYSCPECGKCYPRKSDLVRHQRSHTVERPYSCPECGIWYPRKSDLVRHQRFHTGEKPYS